MFGAARRIASKFSSATSCFSVSQSPSFHGTMLRSLIVCLPSGAREGSASVGVAISSHRAWRSFPSRTSRPAASTSSGQPTTPAETAVCVPPGATSPGASVVA